MSKTITPTRTTKLPPKNQFFNEYTSEVTIGSERSSGSMGAVDDLDSVGEGLKVCKGVTASEATVSESTGPVACGLAAGELAENNSLAVAKASAEVVVGICLTTRS